MKYLFQIRVVAMTIQNHDFFCRFFLAVWQVVAKLFQVFYNETARAEGIDHLYGRALLYTEKRFCAPFLPQKYSCGRYVSHTSA